MKTGDKQTKMKKQGSYNESMLTHKSQPSPPLTVEERRQIFYAALLRYSPETSVLRELALDRVVLCGLLASSPQLPFRIGEIQRNLSRGLDAPEIRVEIIQETLQRLITQGKVDQTLHLKRHAYYLTPDAEKDLGITIKEAEKLFNLVLHRLLKGTDHLFPFDEGATVCRTFICECFARFGKQIAKTVTGRLSTNALINSADAEAAFIAASDKGNLDNNSRDLLSAKCLAFLKSTEPDDEKLKFHLTQGYYVAQLLGLEDGYFDPLARQAFNGAIFYIDTNVLIPRLVARHEQSVLFDEMVKVCKKLGIELRVTKATINEAKQAAANRIQGIKKIINKAPEQILQLITNDKFLSAFLEAREHDPSITPEEFLLPFDKIESILRDEIGFNIEDVTEVEIIKGRDFSNALDAIKKSSETVVGWPKPQHVLAHDVCHYALVSDVRENNSKTWFLTSDRSLVQAGLELADYHQQPFCYTLAGFLQSISPFVTSTEEKSFVDIFSAFLAEQMIQVEKVFDFRDLVVLVELHEDVQTTPTDQLVEAYEYIRREAFNKYPNNRNDKAVLALELRKFLTSSADEQRKTLQQETERLKREREKEKEQAVAERRRREVVEEEADKLRCELASLEEEINVLRESDQNKSEEITQIKQTNEKAINRRLLNHTVAGFIFDFLIFVFRENLIAGIISKYPFFQGKVNIINTCLGILGLLMFLIPAVRLTRNLQWRGEKKLAVIIVLIIIAISISKVLDDTTTSNLSSIIEIASLLGMFAVYAFSQQKFE